MKIRLSITMNWVGIICEGRKLGKTDIERYLLGQLKDSKRTYDAEKLKKH